MKRIIFFLIVSVFTLSSSIAFAGVKESPAVSEDPATPVNTENKLSDAEVDRITKRVEEIRNMDKSDLTSEEKIELKNELKEMRNAVKDSGGTIYIGAGALILIIILVILLV